MTSLLIQSIVRFAVCRWSRFAMISSFFLLTLSCTSFKPIYQHLPNDSITMPAMKIKEGTRLKLVLNDDTTNGLRTKEINATIGLKFVKYWDKNGNHLVRIKDRSFYFKMDSINMYMYKFGKTHHDEVYKNHFIVPIDEIALIERRKFRFGKTMGLVGILIVALSIHAVNTFGFTY